MAGQRYLHGSILLMLALLRVAVPQPSVYAQMDGLKGNIVAATAVDRRPIVTFAITDAKGKPIDLVDLEVHDRCATTQQCHRGLR